ncbi:MAG: hypothetical protein AAF627_03040 [Myxococcota bacterium]
MRLGDLDAMTRNLHDIVADESRGFVGVDALQAFERALGGLDGEAVVLRCRDGYRPRVQIEDLRRERPLLSYASAQGPFTTSGGKALGPYYLAWRRDAEVAPSAFAYQVVGVDWAPERPPYLRAENRGARDFEIWCSACHAMEGWGGRVGPELQAPRPIASWVEPPWLKRWLLAPQSMRAGTAMPGLPQMLTHREAVAERIVEFLVARAEDVESSE